MGNLQGIEMAKRLSPDAGLAWHLRYNHFPPVNLVFVDSCKQAIQACKDEGHSQEIELPNGRVLTAAEIVEQLHLEPWLEVSEDDEGEEG